MMWLGIAVEMNLTWVENFCKVLCIIISQNLSLQQAKM